MALKSLLGARQAKHTRNNSSNNNNNNTNNNNNNLFISARPYTESWLKNQTIEMNNDEFHRSLTLDTH